MATEIADDLAGGSQAKAAILLIVGEPFSDGDKQLILEEIVKGFKGWDNDATGVDINAELTQIANRADLGEESPQGERIIRHKSDNAAVEILINPQSQTVKDSLKAILTQSSPAKAVIYAGYAFQGTAAWVVQDELFTSSTFNQVFKDSYVANALKQVEGASLMLCCQPGSDWISALKGSEVEKLLKVTVNPTAKLEDTNGLDMFSAYIENLIRAVPLGTTLQASDVIGNISFSRPVLYIFPGNQGDAALFGMKGFNMLINGGYSRRSCFWDFVRHLDGIDALLLTHLGPDNLFGIKAMLERKAFDNIHPDIDYMFMNLGKASNGAKAITNGDTSSPDLIINLAAEGSKLVELSRKLGHAPHSLTRSLSGSLEPINLFHKVGKGSLDMYVLNPVADAKEMKDFLTHWSKQATSFNQANGIPIPNCTSVCALLVVRPASSTEKVTRILFPGAAPQHKLLEGLERVKHLEFMKHPTFCNHDLHRAKKMASNGRAGSATRRPVSASLTRTTTTKAEPPKRLETKMSAPRVSATSPSSAKTSKIQKDSSNKRASSGKGKEKVKLDEKEKEDKSKSSTSSSPSKASNKTASPIKTPSSPAQTPATSSPDEAREITATSAGQNQTPAPQPASDEQPISSTLPNNHLDQDVIKADTADIINQAPVKTETLPPNDNRFASSPEALPEPDNNFGLQQNAKTIITEKAKLRELGIYDDDDDDEGVDNGFDKENGLCGARHFAGTEEEEVRPQALPDPVPAVETPSSSEPDLIQDTFPKPSLMEQSQIFEDGIEPDYGAETGELTGAGEPKMEDASLDVESKTTDSTPVTGGLTEGISCVTGSAVEDYSAMTESQIMHSSEPPRESSPAPANELVDESSSGLDQQVDHSSAFPDSVGEHASYGGESQAEDSSPVTEPVTEEYPIPEPEQPASLASAPEQSDFLTQKTEEFPPNDVAADATDTVMQEEEYEKEVLTDDAEKPGRETFEQGGGLAAPYERESSPVSDDLQEPDEVTEEQCFLGREPVLDHQPEADQNLEPSYSDQLGGPSPALEEPSFDDDLKEARLAVEESSISDSIKDTSPAVEEMNFSTGHEGISPDDDEPGFDDHLKETTSAPEEPSFDDSLKGTSEAIGNGYESNFHDSLRDASPGAEEHDSMVNTAPAPNHAEYLDDEKDASQTLAEANLDPGFDKGVREASPAVEESHFDEHVKEPSPAMEEEHFDERVKEPSPAMEEEHFDERVKEPSPAMEEEHFDERVKEPSPAMEEEHFDERVKEPSPAMEGEHFDERVKEPSPAMEEEHFDEHVKEPSPAMEEEHFDERVKEPSPAMEEEHFDEHVKEPSPAMEEPCYDDHVRETSAAVAEAEFDDHMGESSPSTAEVDFGDHMKESSPAMEEHFEEHVKESSPAMEEHFDGHVKEPSPVMEEEHFDERVKEPSPAMEGEHFDEHVKEPSPAMAKEDFDDIVKKTEVSMEEFSPVDGARETSPALEKPGCDSNVMEISPDENAKENGHAFEEPGFDNTVQETSPGPKEAGYEDNVGETETTMEEPDLDEHVKETSPVMEPTGSGDSHREASPVLKEPDFDHGQRDSSPGLEELGVDDNLKAMSTPKDQDSFGEESPALKEQDIENDTEQDAVPLEKQEDDNNLMQAKPSFEEPSFTDSHKENSPAYQEPDFPDENGAVEQRDNTEQSIQHELTDDIDFQVDGTSEKKEEAVVVEKEIMGKEDSDEEEEISQRKEMEKQHFEGDAQVMGSAMMRSTIEGLGESDDEGQDDDEVTAEAADSGDSENDDYVYEKEVNLEDEEVMAGGSKGVAAVDQAKPSESVCVGESGQDQQTSNIPESVEKEVSPVPVEMKKEEEKMQEKADTGMVPVDSRPEDSDSDEDTQDDEKDIDETLAVQRQQQDLIAQEHDKDMEEQDFDRREKQNLNPFVGLEDSPHPTVSADSVPQGKQTNPFEEDEADQVAQKGEPVEFDPLAQWGPPTGLPAPTPLVDEDDATSEKNTDQEPTSCLEFPQGFHAGEAAFKQQGESLGHEAGEEGSSEADPAEFDPLAQWGQPMGLPSPPPPDMTNKSGAARKSAADTKKADPKKASATKTKPGTEKRSNVGTKSPAKPLNGTADTPKSSRSKPEMKKTTPDTPRSTRSATNKSMDATKGDSKSRTPTSATRRTANTAKMRASPDVVKMPPLPPFTPFYMDLTYIPNHGDLAYVDSEFFKRVRARYYVLSARNPNPKVLELLIDAKGTWDKASEQEVTVIPTYETQILQHWMAVHKEKLAENKIDIAPAASRCTVRLQDHEDSCYTYRLEF